MRRRRPGLQVSTFPFLAVLLCTMGSLILLLLVIDRRARVVARAKALETAAKLAAETDHRAEDAAKAVDAARAAAAKRAAARAAEFERRRQALHDSLNEQYEQLTTQYQALQTKAAAAGRDLSAERDKIAQLQSRFQEGSASFQEEQEAVRKREAALSHTAKETEASQQDLARLSSTLVRMERTLADLKALRQQQQKKYSLVPYKGRRGDNRRPLYIECTIDGLVFHPDRQHLEGLGISAGDIRREVQRRIDRRPNPAETPYLLMLIRPDGILTYYKTLASLEGMKLDFGYEFVEADWLLDFPDADDVKPQPWMVTDAGPNGGKASTPLDLRPPAGTIARSPGLMGVGLRSGGNGWRGDGSLPAGPPGYSGGVNSGSGMPPGAVPTPGFGKGTGIAGTGFGPGSEIPGNGNAAPGGGTDTGFTRPGFGPAPSPGEPLVPGTGALGNGFGPPSGGTPNVGTPGSAEPGGTPGMENRPMYRGNETGTPGLPTDPNNPGTALAGGSGGGSSGGGRPGANLGRPVGAPEAGTGEPGAGGGPESDTSPGQPGTPTTGDQGPPNPVQPPRESASGFPAPSPGPGAPSGSPSGNGPAVVPPFSSSFANSGGQPGTANASGGTGSGSPLPPGEPPSPGEAGTPGIGALQLPLDRPGPRLPVRPPRLFGNRDWPITLDCTADGVTLLGTGQHIPLDRLDDGTGLLLQTVRQMVARRQAGLRPGEPPYRPLLRFQVHPDGLRTYYLAYPVLDPLRLPMTRENVFPAEDKSNPR